LPWRELELLFLNKPKVGTTIKARNTKPEETIKTRLSVSLFFLGILFKD
jgi:hypothetical protein